MNVRFACFLLLLLILDPASVAVAAGSDVEAKRKVYVVAIREDIYPPLLYVVRRGVKEAMAAKAELLVVDMDTNGGRVSTTEEIMDILNNFKGQTATFVNKKAFSAGAIIAIATQKIFMAPQSVIGAAAPIMMIPGAEPKDMPETMQAKMNSALRALVRTAAEKNGHNVDVVEAMIDKSKELKIDGKVLNEKGQILTLTNTEAEKEYGDPPKRLLSAGTVESIEELLRKLGYADAEQVYVKPTGAETLASWINAISPLLLIIGIVGLYIEFKTPGFGVPGIVGICSFALYFLGGYIAGLSGMEWIALFILGLALVALEIFVFPGTAFLGFAGAALMLTALIMAMVDVYPGMPALPTFDKLQMPLTDLMIAFVGAGVAMFFLSRWLPKTSLYGKLISQSASGVGTVVELEQKQTARIGQIGIAVSPLRPGGKAQFANDILDVITQGEMIEKGEKVKIVGHSGAEAIVEAVG